MGTYRERPVMGPAFSMVHVLRMLRAPSIKAAIFVEATHVDDVIVSKAFG